MAARSSGLDAVARYLDSLPAGVASHPECQMKGAVIRAYFDSLPAISAPPELPAEAIALLEQPPAPSAWVPEVVCHVLMLLAAHDLFETEDAYLDHVLRTNRALFESLTYRVLFSLVRPKTTLAQASARWGLFHAGTTLEPVGKIRRGSGDLVLRAPPDHCPLVLAKGYAASFRAVVEAAGASGAEVEVELRNPGEVLFRARWR